MTCRPANFARASFAPPLPRPDAGSIPRRDDRIAIAAFRALQFERPVEEHGDVGLVPALAADMQLRWIPADGDGGCHRVIREKSASHAIRFAATMSGRKLSPVTLRLLLRSAISICCLWWLRPWS